MKFLLIFVLISNVIFQLNGKILPKFNESSTEIDNRIIETSSNTENNTDIEDDVIAPRIMNWSHLVSSVSDLFVLKKNIIAAYPFEIAATVIDVLCSSTLLFHNVPDKITPDINKMHFQYITACKNYSVPLTEAEKLWTHTHFNKMKNVVILATGWTNTVNDSSAIALMSKAFLCRKDVNFVIVDAASYVDTLYKWAALNTEEIGAHIAVGLTHLVKLVPLENIHLVGHSLGAHIMGSAARTFTKLTGRKIPRITGLDPAKPCFRKNETLAGLHRGDASFIDVIHTNIGILAKREPLGDMDFYPGGANALPPGCITIGCAHSRALEYFAESVYPGNEYNFLGFKCDSWKSLKRVDCIAGAQSPMGYVVEAGEKGIFYVDVNRKSPFGKRAKTSNAIWESQKCHICGD